MTVFQSSIALKDTTQLEVSTLNPHFVRFVQTSFLFVDTWTKVKNMLNRRCRLGVACLNGKLYAAGGYDGNSFLKSVECYDPSTDTWSSVCSMNVKRSRVALAANMGKLWAIGGYDGESNLSTVEVYDATTDSWSFVAPMVCHGGGVGAGVIPNQ